MYKVGQKVSVKNGDTLGDPIWMTGKVYEVYSSKIRVTLDSCGIVDVPLTDIKSLDKPSGPLVYTVENGAPSELDWLKRQISCGNIFFLTYVLIGVLIGILILIYI